MLLTAPQRKSKVASLPSAGMSDFNHRWRASCRRSSGSSELPRAFTRANATNFFRWSAVNINNAVALID
jgi:hypothetical protein